MKYPRISGFVGYRGTAFHLKPLPDNHPVVEAFPHLFRDAPSDSGASAAQPTKSKRGRPPRTVAPVESKSDVVDD